MPLIKWWSLGKSMRHFQKCSWREDLDPPFLFLLVNNHVTFGKNTYEYNFKEESL